MSRETWMVKNNTSKSLTIGDLPKVPAIQPKEQSIC